MPDVETHIPIEIENGKKVDDNLNKEAVVTNLTKELSFVKDKNQEEGTIEKGKEKSEKDDTSQPKQRSVSFNRDVHVKRFGRRDGRSVAEYQSSVRKEPFTHLSEKELIEEANKVLAQAEGVSCTTDKSPERFYSLPNRKKHKTDDRESRRNSEDLSDEKLSKNLGRSTSDVGSLRKRSKERTSLSTLFRRAKNPAVETPIKAQPKPVIVKRSKSDVSDLKSNTSLNTHPKPVRKRSGSESEEFLKSLRNKKTQLSPIIESSPREDYFKKSSPLDFLIAVNKDKQNTTSNQDVIKSQIIEKVNPVEKPPRYKGPEIVEPKPPKRSKKSKSKESSPSITETPKRKTENTLLVDELDKVRDKDINPIEIKERIKESIRKLENNIYGERDMIHSSQQPPDKLPLTKGQTVDHIVKILKEDQEISPSKAHLIASPAKSGTSLPFSYIRPSVSPDPNLFTRPVSPNRPVSPVNKMNNDKGVVYAQVVKNERDNSRNGFTKQTIHKTYLPGRIQSTNFSDEDEGLGYEERSKFTIKPPYNHEEIIKYDDDYSKQPTCKLIDSPITPRFKEYRMNSFSQLEPTYANDYPSGNGDFIDSSFRGIADGMDSKRKQYTDSEVIKEELDPEFNELSYRRQLLESRLNSRRLDLQKDKLVSSYFQDAGPLSDIENRMKATERYVDETARYYRHSFEKDGFVEQTINDDYEKNDSKNGKIKYNTTTKMFEQVSKDDIDRREFLDRNVASSPLHIMERQSFPPEPEYEPPSLESTPGNLTLNPDQYIEKKYKLNSRQFVSSQETSTHKYKKGDMFGKRKGHYASNPEITQERQEVYDSSKYDPKYSETYHNSLRRAKNRDEHHYRDKYHENRHRLEDSPRLDAERDNKFFDSGIENDFKKHSSGEIFKPIKYKNKYESDDEAQESSLFISNEKKHGQINSVDERIYTNGGYHRSEDSISQRKPFTPRERSIDDGSFYDPRIDRYESPDIDKEKMSAKPPKATKKFSGLDKVKQLFSRDSSKKSKKETVKEPVEKNRTRVLKSPIHLVESEERYRLRISEDDVRDKEKDDKSDFKYVGNVKVNKIDREDQYQRQNDDLRRRYREYRGSSEDRDSDHRNPRTSDAESDIKPSRVSSRLTRSKTHEPIDSPRLVERYRERRRLATPSPTPSPPRKSPPTSGSWFKSLDRLSKKRNKKVEKDANTEGESTLKKSSKTKPKVNSPPKNLRFFGDTDPDSDANLSNHAAVTKTKSHPQNKSHTLLRKTISNSSTGIDEIDRGNLSNKSYSLSNLRKEESPRPYYKNRNLHNISENQSYSETESHLDSNRIKSRKYDSKPPLNPYDRSRSQSSSRNTRSNSRVRRIGSKNELRSGEESRGSSSEIRGSKQELNGKLRRRTPGTNSGESSTEGESSHRSHGSIVYLHATTVGDIPDPGRISRGRSRDDVSSINSSNIQAKTVSRSFSLFAPWTPRHYNDPHDVNYAQTSRPPKRTHKQSSPKESLFGKKTPSNQKLNEGSLQKNRSSSQSTLTRRPKPSNSRLSNSSSTLYRREKRSGDRDYKKSVSTEVLSREDKADREKVSRSISMPKDGKKAGWFKLSSKTKKPEQPSRIR